MKKNLIFKFTFVFIVIFLSLQNISAQRTLYWTLEGNSNATSTSMLGTTNATDLRFVTNNVERMRITSAGQIGIGTTTPSYKLHVIGNALFSTGVTVSDGGIFSSNSAGNGLTGLGTFSGVSGNGTFYGVRGNSTGSNSSGVYGTGVGYGVYGSGAYGIYGLGNSFGMYGTGTNGGVWGNTENGYYGVLGTSTNYNGVFGFGATNGVYGTTNGASNALQATTAGVYGYNGNYGAGVWGSCFNGPGILGSSVNYYAGYFLGSVYSSGSFVGSDRKLKKNIGELTSALEIINKLKPKSYEFREDGNYKLMNLPKGKHYGLIAQELEQILPGLVKETNFNTDNAQPTKKADVTIPLSSEKSFLNTFAPDNTAAEKSETIDFKAVNYTELIPIMIKAMQELSEKNKDLQQQVSELKELINKSNGKPIKSAPSSILLQNMPNPVKGSTIIKYGLPERAKQASLVITDNLGKIIQTVNLNSSGMVNLDISTLNNGVYNYTLVVDNNTLQTKKMTVIK